MLRPRAGLERCSSSFAHGKGVESVKVVEFGRQRKRQKRCYRKGRRKIATTDMMKP